jgi:hypothetical protein
MMGYQKIIQVINSAGQLLYLLLFGNGAKARQVLVA